MTCKNARQKKPRLSAVFYTCGVLHVEAEVQDVTVFNNVFLAFQTPFTGFFRARFTVELDEIVVGDHFSTDKAFLDRKSVV